jgi:hypothetical protein
MVVAAPAAPLAPSLPAPSSNTLGRALSERLCTVRIGSKNNSARTGHAKQEGIASYHLNEGLDNLNLTPGIAAVNTGSEDLAELSESTISDKSPDRDLRTASYSDIEREELKNQDTPSTAGGKR